MAESSASDWLVNLYSLPETSAAEAELARNGITVRRALVPEKSVLTHWVEEHFSAAWADECAAAFSGHPVRCWIATQDRHPVGFSVYDSIALGMAGPIGVAPQARTRGIGSLLLTRTLQAMRAQGYAYAVIGWVAADAIGFYQTVAGAVPIAHSAPHTGLYRDLLRRD
ncbi:MAG: GNAT family N-acetyltransferase [Rhodothalassiaceae bacterium]